LRTPRRKLTGNERRAIGGGSLFSPTPASDERDEAAGTVHIVHRHRLVVDGSTDDCSATDGSATAVGADVELAVASDNAGDVVSGFGRHHIGFHVDGSIIPALRISRSAPVSSAGAPPPAADSRPSAADDENLTPSPGSALADADTGVAVVAPLIVRRLLTERDVVRSSIDDSARPLMPFETECSCSKSSSSVVPDGPEPLVALRKRDAHAWRTSH
jgi:hypothetical protein